MNSWQPRPRPASRTGLIVMLCGACMLLSAVAVGAALTTAAEQREFAAIADEAIPVPRQYGPAVGMTATWYGQKYCGRKTASGVIFDCQSYTAAHRTLPFGTKLQVAFQGRQVEVVINDRGPLEWTGKDLDLSEAAFAQLAPLSTGVLRVQVRRVIP